MTRRRRLALGRVLVALLQIPITGVLVRLFTTVLLVLTTATARAQSVALYRAEFLQSAPGRMLELLDVLKAEQAVYDAAGEARPFLMRHSQGDRWDFVLLVPMGDDLSAYFSSARVGARARSGVSGASHDAKRHELVQWHEELYVRGPSMAEVAAQFDAAGFAHLEIFQALSGAYDNLMKERAMEDQVNRATGRAPLLIFAREPALGGGAWDSFSIDLYRDLQDYAQRALVAPDVQDRAARVAGFESGGMIGPTLRRYIAIHHDTLLGVVK